MAHRTAPLALEVAYRLLIALAVAGTIAHAVVFWPQSLMLTLAVLALAVGLVLTGRGSAATR